MKKQERIDYIAQRQRDRRARQWAAWRETAFIAAFFVLILASAAVAQWWIQ
jgi:hypothetical protein